MTATRLSPGTDHPRIMYVCTICADDNPEGCGHFDRNDLRVLPSGDWLCEGCFEETSLTERAEGSANRSWHGLPPPRAYIAKDGP